MGKAKKSRMKHTEASITGNVGMVGAPSTVVMDWSTGHKIHLKGFRLDKKTGKPVRNLKNLPANVQRAMAGSKKVKPNRGTK